MKINEERALEWLLSNGSHSAPTIAKTLLVTLQCVCWVAAMLCCVVLLLSISMYVCCVVFCVCAMRLDPS